MAEFAVAWLPSWKDLGKGNESLQDLPKLAMPQLWERKTALRELWRPRLQPLRG